MPRSSINSRDIFAQKKLRPPVKTKAAKVAGSIQLVLNKDYLPTLLNLLEQARSRIDILAYSFAIGSAQGVLATKNAPYQIASKLAEIKRKRGDKVRIRLYIEGLRETAARNKTTVDFLRKAGVEIVYGSTHSKGFCIDNRFLLFGSTNLTNQSILKNYETNLLIDDPHTATVFDQYFMHLWNGGKHGGILLEPPLIADGGFKDVLIEMIDTAKTSLNFSIYFFNHSEIEKAFVRAAKRGVKVSGFIHHHNSFALGYVRRTRDTAMRLMKAGIIDLYFGPGHLFTHSKYIVKDGTEILLGTGNWLHEDVKIHPQLYIHFKNPKIARELIGQLIKQINDNHTNQMAD
ncbi:phospholipase D-like domain-containing protein [Bdellovibrio sp. HCB-110]|uniref:phospholipase D-like domain-containing protein n=1 Tax=Bdellovibrio sp. HCB-110 TaxID=3391182 RepID=UPI0039B4DE79